MPDWTSMWRTELRSDEICVGDVLLFVVTPASDVQFGAFDRLVADLDGVPFAHAAVVTKASNSGLPIEIVHSLPEGMVRERLQRQHPILGSAPAFVLRPPSSVAEGVGAIASGLGPKGKAPVGAYPSWDPPLAAIALRGDEVFEPDIAAKLRWALAYRAAESVSDGENLMCAAFAAHVLAEAGVDLSYGRWAGSSPTFSGDVAEAPNGLASGLEEALAKGLATRLGMPAVLASDLVNGLVGAGDAGLEALASRVEAGVDSILDGVTSVPLRLWTCADLLAQPPDSLAPVGFVRDWGTEWRVRRETGVPIEEQRKKWAEKALAAEFNEVARALLLGDGSGKTGFFANGDWVAFVGAGAGAGLGIPTWEKLVTKLARKAGLDRRDLDPKASAQTSARRIRRVLQEKPAPEDRWDATLLSALDAAFENRHATTDVYRSVVAARPKALVTTNYDLGAVHARYEAVPDGGAPSFAYDVAGERTADSDKWCEPVEAGLDPLPILYLHGVIDQPGSIVLGTDDYGYAYRAGQPHGEIFQSLWSRENLVFIGFGMHDPWLEMKLGELTAGTRTRQPGPRHVAFCSGWPPSKEHLEDPWETAAFRFPLIVLESGLPDYGVLPELLRLLAERAGVAPPTPAPAPKGPPSPIDVFAADDSVRLVELIGDPTARGAAITGSIEQLTKIGWTFEWIRGPWITIDRLKAARSKGGKHVVFLEFDDHEYVDLIRSKRPHARLARAELYTEIRRAMSVNAKVVLVGRAPLVELEAFRGAKVVTIDAGTGGDLIHRGEPSERLDRAILALFLITGGQWSSAKLCDFAAFEPDKRSEWIAAIHRLEDHGWLVPSESSDSAHDTLTLPTELMPDVRSHLSSWLSGEPDLLELVLNEDDSGDPAPHDTIRVLAAVITEELAYGTFGDEELRDLAPSVASSLLKIGASSHALALLRSFSEELRLRLAKLHAFSGDAYEALRLLDATWTGTAKEAGELRSACLDEVWDLEEAGSSDGESFLDAVRSAREPPLTWWAGVTDGDLSYMSPAEHPLFGFLESAEQRERSAARYYALAGLELRRVRAVVRMLRDPDRSFDPLRDREMWREVDARMAQIGLPRLSPPGYGLRD